MHYRTALFALFTLLVGGACSKKSPGRGPLVDRFETRTPIAAFYPISKAVATDFHQGDRNNYYWALRVPVGTELYSQTSNTEKYRSLYKAYGIVSQIPYWHHAPIPNVFFASGIKSLRVTLIDNGSGNRSDLTPAVSILYTLYLRECITDPLKAGEKNRTFPSFSERREQRTPLPELKENDLRWVFWTITEPFFAKQIQPVYLQLKANGVDITKGKLLLTIERENDSPLEIKLPQR